MHVKSIPEAPETIDLHKSNQPRGSGPAWYYSPLVTQVLPVVSSHWNRDSEYLTQRQGK